MRIEKLGTAMLMRPLDQGNETWARDRELVERCRSADESACRELLRLYRDRVVNLAYGVLGSRADAEDAAQLAFIKVFTKLGGFRGESAFSSWLYRIVVNECMTLTRGSCRTEVPLEEEIRREDPDARLTEHRSEVRTVLDSLPASLRTVLVLREVDQLSYKEMAEALGVPMGTIRSRLSYAREKFREKYREIMRDEV